MDPKLDTQKIQKALVDYINTDGATWSELEKIANVYNLGKISRGETVPTVTTWLKLHHAAPHVIPEPAYLTGGEDGKRKSVVLSQGGSGNIQAVAERDAAQQSCGPCTEYGADMQALMELTRALRSPLQIKQMIKELEREKGELEGGY